jgi:hypothetical protein
MTTLEYETQLRLINKVRRQLDELENRLTYEYEQSILQRRAEEEWNRSLMTNTEGQQN